MFEKIVTYINNVIWSPALVVICILAGIFFSCLTRFVQVRRIGHMFHLLFNGDKENDIGVSSFQSFCMALSGRVGTGNIVGVATAIAYGGPGAIFWMWIIAFLGASSAFVESTLAQIYKVKTNSEFRGGPSYYILKGIKCKWLAVLFSICGIVACGFLLPTVQANGVAVAFNSSFGINPLYVGIILDVLLAIVVIGGVKRIANVAQIITPFMALGYILMSLIIICCNVKVIPNMFELIITNAFGINPVCGGILGSTIMWGVKRGIFSNEAGQGTGAIISSAANVSHPAKQGFVQACSVYIDTLFVCTATALMILSTGMYNILDSKTGEILVNNVPKLSDNYVTYTQAAVDTVFPGFGNIFVAIALFLFVYTTLFAYYYYAETSIVFVCGLYSNKINLEKLLINVLRFMMLVAICFGSVRQTFVAWQLGDIGVGLMAWINIIAIFILFPKAIRTFNDYESQQKIGIKNPCFNSRKLKIDNADFWTGIEDENK